MAVEFVLERPGAEPERFPLTTLRGMTGTVCPLARELGLRLVPYFDSFYSVDPSNVRDVLAELRLIRTALEQRNPEWESIRYNLDQIIQALSPLTDVVGWEGSFG